MDWKRELKRDYDKGRLDDNQRVNGMPLKAVRAMLDNPNTPEQIKRAWRAKLKLKGLA